MARHLRVEYPGAIYHVTCRMVGDRRSEETLLFKDDADRERFLDRLAERVEQYHIRLYLSPSAWQCASRCGGEVLDSVLGTEPARGGRNPRSRDGIGSL